MFDGQSVAFSALTLLVWRQERHPACKKTERWGAGMVICLELGADLHMAQLMPLPLTVSCFSKIQIGFTILVPAHPGSPGQRAFERVCVCVCVRWSVHARVCACVRARTADCECRRGHSLEHPPTSAHRPRCMLGRRRPPAFPGIHCAADDRETSPPPPSPPETEVSASNSG